MSLNGLYPHRHDSPDQTTKKATHQFIKKKGERKKMEVIKNYLETMFKNIPDTEEARRAKEELLSMLEDKYNELIDGGMSENEVVGTIISEFGSPEELAESLGLTKPAPEPVSQESYVSDSRVVVDVPAVSDYNKRLITFEEADEYLIDSSVSRFMLALGVFLCIISPAGPVLGESLCLLFGRNVFSGFIEGLGIVFLFIAVAAGVGLIILSSSKQKAWNFIQDEPCTIDNDTEDYLKNEIAENSSRKTFMLAGGIILCIVSVVPVSLFSVIGISLFLISGVGPAMIFILTGLGVFFILNSSARESACEKLLSLKQEQAA